MAEIGANLTAMKALHHSLSKNQRKMLNKYGYFGVKGGDGHSYWLIEVSYQNEYFKIYSLYRNHRDEWMRDDFYCVIVGLDETNEYLPWPDEVLAVKEILESKEGEAYFLANAVRNTRFPHFLPPDFVI